VGIDLGTCFIKVSGVNKGKIEIIKDETEKR
jgi:molecular chaperone DnaK (HSP70)